MRAYTKKGPVVVALNHKMVDAALGNLVKIDVPAAWGTVGENQSILDVVYDRPGVRRGEEDNIPGFITNIMDPVLALEGDKLPVSAMTPGGYMESGTCEFEKRGIAPEIPVWIGDTCTQCNYCAIVCPHAVVRPFLLDKAEAKAAPADFEMRKAQGGAETAGYQYTIQLASMDCTGCAVCVQSCPDDSLYMAPYTQRHRSQRHISRTGSTHSRCRTSTISSTSTRSRAASSSSRSWSSPAPAPAAARRRTSSC